MQLTEKLQEIESEYRVRMAAISRQANELRAERDGLVNREREACYLSASPFDRCR